MMKRKIAALGGGHSDVEGDDVYTGGEDDWCVEVDCLSSAWKRPARSVKEEQRSVAKAEVVLLRAQARAAAVMAAAKMREALAMEDQAALSLFRLSVLELEAMTPQGREYVELRQADELLKLRRRLANERALEAREDERRSLEGLLH